MNLFTFHNKPEKLVGHDELLNRASFIWTEVADMDNADYDEYFADASVLEPYESVLAKEPYYAYMYAHYVLDDRFPEGEDAIATSDQYSFMYANEVLFKRFKKGEKAILNSHYADGYKAQMRQYGDEL